MQRITVIAGLPGSGKTALARVMCSGLRSDLYDLYDDFCASEDGFSLTKSITTGRNAVLTTPFILNQKDKDKMVAYLNGIKEGVTVEFIWFDNDPEQCRANAYNRLKNDPDKRVIGLIRELSVQYAIPKNETVTPVWRPRI